MRVRLLVQADSVWYIFMDSYYVVYGAVRDSKRTSLLSRHFHVFVQFRFVDLQIFSCFFLYFRLIDAMVDLSIQQHNEALVAP